MKNTIFTIAILFFFSLMLATTVARAQNSEKKDIINQMEKEKKEAIDNLLALPVNYQMMFSLINMEDESEIYCLYGEINLSLPYERREDLNYFFSWLQECLLIRRYLESQNLEEKKVLKIKIERSSAPNRLKKKVFKY